MRIKINLLSVSISCVCLLGCDLINQNKDQPTGVSTLTAKIKDSTYIFSFKNPPSQYFGIATVAVSGQYEMYLYVNNSDSGSYNWRTTYGMFDSSPNAKLNNLEALRDIGGLTVTKYSHEDNYLQGTFDFAVVDSSGFDTIRVKEGEFQFYYVNEK